jgi:hypothetical protein
VPTPGRTSYCAFIRNRRIDSLETRVSGAPSADSQMSPRTTFRKCSTLFRANFVPRNCASKSRREAVWVKTEALVRAAALQRGGRREASICPCRKATSRSRRCSIPRGGVFVRCTTPSARGISTPVGYGGSSCSTASVIMNPCSRACKFQCDISTGNVIASIIDWVTPPSTSSRALECP